MEVVTFGDIEGTAGINHSSFTHVPFKNKIIYNRDTCVHSLLNVNHTTERSRTKFLKTSFKRSLRFDRDKSLLFVFI